MSDVTHHYALKLGKSDEKYPLKVQTRVISSFLILEALICPVVQKSKYKRPHV